MVYRSNSGNSVDVTGLLPSTTYWVKIYEYSGSGTGQAGINYQAFRNVGIGLYYKGFILDVDIDKSDWHGRADLNQNGPLLTVTATW